MTKANEGMRCEDFRRHVLILFYIIHDKVTLCSGPSEYQREEYFKSFVFVPSPSVSLFYLRFSLADWRGFRKWKSKNRIGCERFRITHTPQTRHISTYHRRRVKSLVKRLLLGIECTSLAFLNPGSQHRFSWLFNRRSPFCVVVFPATTTVSLDAVTIKNGTGQNLCLLKRCCFCSLFYCRQQCCTAEEEVEKSLAGCVTLINVNRVSSWNKISRNLINCENSHARKKEN